MKTIHHIWSVLNPILNKSVKRASIGELNDFYRYCDRNSGGKYHQHFKHIIDDVRKYRKDRHCDYIHYLVLPMIIAALRDYFESQTYDSVYHFSFSKETIDCSATLLYADISKAGQYRYIFVTDDNQLIEYYTRIDLQDQLGQTVRIFTYDFRIVTSRGKDVARVKHLQISK